MLVMRESMRVRAHWLDLECMDSCSLETLDCQVVETKLENILVRGLLSH